MERATTIAIRIGDWRVDPATGQIERNGETARLDARAMRLLLCLAERASEVVSIDALLDQVWAGVTVSQDSVYQAVTSLRRQLGDDAKEPKSVTSIKPVMIPKTPPMTVSIVPSKVISARTNLRVEPNARSKPISRPRSLTDMEKMAAIITTVIIQVAPAAM